MKISSLLLVALFGVSAAAVPNNSRRGLKGSRKDKPRTTEEQEHRALKDPDIDLGDAIGIGCFSEVVTTRVQDRGVVAMKDLQVGDKVLTVGGNYQTVYAFGHHLPEQRGNFVQLYYSKATPPSSNSDGDSTKTPPLELTGEHLVYLDDKKDPVRADSVRLGDRLRHSPAEAEDGAVITVTHIATVERKGVYAPFTPEGTIAVNQDNIAASSYISFQQQQQDDDDSSTPKTVLLGLLSEQDYVHMGLSPLRLACMGISPRYCRHVDEHGMPLYAAFAVRVNQWIFQQQNHIMVAQRVAFLMIVLMTGLCFVLETIFGPSLAPLAIFSILCAFVWRRNCTTTSTLRGTKNEMKHKIW